MQSVDLSMHVLSKSLFFIIYLFSTLNLSLANSFNHSAQDGDYSKAWCEENNGYHQKPLGSYGRADCVTDKFAAEIEFIDLVVKQGIAQATRYAHATKKQALVVVIVENEAELTLFLKQKTYWEKQWPKIAFKSYGYPVSQKLDAHLKSNPPVKLSKSLICHPKNKGSYAVTTKYTPYNTIRECCASNPKSRLPKNFKPSITELTECHEGIQEAINKLHSSIN
ncbi:MAG: hypothetical protein R3A80_07625 [Bdellovibrionota bacterium]